MESTERTDKKQNSVARKLLYRCVCGVEFEVGLDSGGKCTSCQRMVQPEALRTAMNATVSITSLDDSSHASHLEFQDSEDIRHESYGHFRLDSKIGTGGMGAVYRALDTSLQRFVAVKVMRNPSHCSDARIAAMLREAIAQARLNHPNVVTIYYVGREGEEPFLAMELLPGPTLADRIRSEGTIPYSEAIRFAIQVVSALEHASQFGIVHGDIKPANLLLTTENNIKLSDFGLSSLSNGGKAEMVSGTPAYLAPELLNGQSSIQSDMYALGVTLFELVFGRPPFQLQGETVRERLRTHETATIDLPSVWPSNIPREFANVIAKLLAKTPSERYDTYESLLADLRSIQPVSTTTAGLAPRMMAYATDQAFLLFCLLPFALIIVLLTDESLERYQWIVPIVAFVSLIVPAVYLTLIHRGWRSLGRYLFQLRIVEENGLAPRREQLVTREVLRNALAWFGPLVIYVSLYYDWIGRIPDLLLVSFVASDAAVTILRKDRKALHDYLCHSRVVLATDRQNSSKTELNS